MEDGQDGGWAVEDEGREGRKGRREGRRYGLALGALPFNTVSFFAGGICL